MNASEVSDAAPERPLDLLKLFETLERHRVNYIVIGGVATQLHGHRRTTKDLDLMPAPGPDNYERLAAALEEIGAHPTDAAPTDLPLQLLSTDPERMALAAVLPPLITDHGELHILNQPKGAAPYVDLRKRALVIDLDGVELAIVGLDDLIRMKRATGRPRDLEDIAVLVAVERRDR